MAISTTTSVVVPQISLVSDSEPTIPPAPPIPYRQKSNTSMSGSLSSLSTSWVETSNPLRFSDDKRVFTQCQEDHSMVSYEPFYYWIESLKNRLESKLGNDLREYLIEPSQDDNDIKKAIHKMLNTLFSSNLDVQSTYRSFLQQSRTCLELISKEPHAQNCGQYKSFMQAVAYEIYTGSPMLPFGRRLQHHLLGGFQDNNQVSISNFAEYLEIYNSMIEKQKKSLVSSTTKNAITNGKLSAYSAGNSWDLYNLLIQTGTKLLAGSFSPTDNRNLPLHYGTLTFTAKEDTIQTQLLRHGSPICQNEIDPLFINALQRNLNETFLYVNLQKEVGDVHEEDRSIKIRSLQEASPNFFVLSLPFDIRVENQELSYNAFKESLLSKIQKDFCNENSKPEFHFPLAFKQELEKEKIDIATFLEPIFTKVKNNYFAATDMFSEKKQRVFIFCFYHELVERLIIDLQINHLVKSCKDNQDRGIAKLIIDMVLWGIKTGKTEDSLFFKNLSVLMQLPAFINKGQEVLPHRLQVAQDVIQHFANMEKSKLQELSESLQKEALKEGITEITFSGENELFTT